MRAIGIVPSSAHTCDERVSTTISITVPEKGGQPIRIKWWATVSGLVALGVLCALWISRPRQPLFMQAPGHQEERLHTVSTGDVIFSVSPGAFHSIKFVVPQDHRDANLKGHFGVVSGDGADGIQAFLLNEIDYTNWQNGYTTYRYYDSGNVRHANLDVPLLEWEAGVYYLVFNNHSPAPRKITANLTLTYSASWWPGKKE